jgi:hypothetical protein
MKNVLFAFALRVTLLFAAFAFVAVVTSSAQSALRRTRPVMLPPFIVAEDRFTPPELHSDDALSLPDGTVANHLSRNADGSITLPDGTVIWAPVHNADGTVTFSDGTVVTPPTRNADGTLTAPDGTIIDPAHRPAHRGKRPTGDR